MYYYFEFNPKTRSAYETTRTLNFKFFEEKKSLKKYNLVIDIEYN